MNERIERVLIVDDDTELCQLLTEYLTGEGFAIDCVHDGVAGALRAVSNEYRILVLDVMLPGANGFEVLRRIRASSSIPVVMLTARGDEVDRIVGFELGADDYLSKPFSPRELVARLRAILRRAATSDSASSPQPEVVSVGDIVLNTGTRTATSGGRPVALTTVEFELLAGLLRSAGRVATRDELASVALGRSYSPLDRSIDTHVSNLRRKLGPTSDGQPRIKSVRGTGYQLVWAGSDPTD